MTTAADDGHIGDEYAILWRLAGDYLAEFRIVEVCGFSETAPGSGVFAKPSYKLRYGADPDNGLEAEHPRTDTDDILKAEVYIEGDLKWDGCMNMTFHEETKRNTMLHFCGLAGWTSLGEVMTRIWTEVGPHIPAADMGAEKVHK